MLHIKSDRANTRRRAAILMVTIVLLTLFLAVGITFLLLAQSHATSSRIYREASHYLADEYPSAQELLNWSLGDIIYDSEDSSGGASAAYGHSLARNMYGWNYRRIANPDGTFTISSEDAVGNVINATPFNGAGRPNGTGAIPLKYLVNYQTMTGLGARRPEWIQPTGDSDADTGGTLYYTGGFNPPYTYPDLNNLYLAAVRADGTVLKPSYWPGDLNGLGPADPANPNLTNAAFQRYSLRPLNAPTLHPNFPLIGVGGDIRNRPLGWGPPGNDSVWIDLGFPVKTLAVSGRKYKPMFAILIMDLDGRINVNATGNLRGSPSQPPYPPAMGGIPPTDTHTSLQGWGKNEINPLWLGNAAWTTRNATNLTEFQRLYWGDSSIGLNGRYGLWDAANLNTVPKPVPTYFAPPNDRTTGGAWPRYYAKGDWDGAVLPTQGGGADPVNRMLIPSNYPGPYFSAFPYFGAPSTTRFGDGAYFEARNHPLLFNPFMLNRLGNADTNATIQNDRLLPISDLRWFLAHNNSAEIANAELYKLAPTFMNDPRQRNMITPYSMDLDLMGAAPGQLQGGYQLANANADPAALIPVGAATSYTTQLLTRGANPNPGGDFLSQAGAGMSAGDWRSQLATLGRIDLNRPMTAFPPAPTSGDVYSGLQATQAVRAMSERVYSAREVFTRLKYASGVRPLVAADYPPGANQPGSAVFETQRYLAQLAVNIVDYVDEDEFSTPFNWAYDQLSPWAQRPDLAAPYPNHPSGNNGNWAQFTWTFGTELPRLVINEAYAQATNRLSDQLMTSNSFTPGSDLDPDTLASQGARPFATMTAVERMNARATADYQVNFFVELHHPHNSDPNQGENNGEERLWLNVPGRAAYRLVVRSDGIDPGTGNVDPASRVNYVLDRPWNVTGDPNAMPNSSRVNFTFQDFTTPMDFSSSAPNVWRVRPSNGSYGDRTANDANNNGYYVIGPWQTGLSAADQSFYRFPHDRAQPGPVVGTFGATMARDAGGGGMQNNRMHQYLPNTTPVSAFNPADMTEAPKYKPTIVLQRLANPYMPYDPSPTSGVYNPYITVDYIENVPINDAVLATPGGLRNMAPNERTPVENRRSVGRRQPFRARGLTPQSPMSGGMGSVQFAAQSTFFRQNGQEETAGAGAGGTTLDYPFDWVTHLDRVLINPAELVHVSRLKPHLLTHYFINDNNPAPPAAGTKDQHVVPWRAGSHRLYRAFELLGTRDRSEATAFGGRVMGRVNINMIYEAEVFRAICDAQAGNYFDATVVDNVWNALRSRRTASPLGIPSAADRPYWSLAMPNDAGAADAQYPLAGAGGVEKCLFGTSAPNTPMINVPPGGTVPQHPYVQNELLQKIMGHLTTRSNVFAVWITTGFFEVENPFQQPPRMGSEVDTRLRHKFFAIIDRTNLTVDWSDPRSQGDRPIFFPFLPSNANDKYLEPGSVTIRVPNVRRTSGVAPAAVFTLFDSVAHGYQDFLSNGFAPEYTYDIQIGSKLVIGSGDSKEIVTVTGLNALNQTITVMTTRRHYLGDAVCTQRIGNPGPQGQIDYSLPKYSQTIAPYTVILQ